MGVFPVLVMTGLCLFIHVSGEDGENCIYKGKTYKHGDVVTDNCQICECDNGELVECSVNVDCNVVPEKASDTIVIYNDDPDVFGSSNTIAGGQNREKRSVKMPENFLKVSEKQGGNKNSQSQIFANLPNGGVISQRSGGSVFSSSSEVKTNILGGRVSSSIHGDTQSSEAKGERANIFEDGKQIKLNASFQVGGLAGVQSGVVVSSSGEKKEIIGQQNLIDVKSNIGLGNANLNAGGILGLNGKVHGDHREISEQGINVNGNLNLGGIGGFHQSSEERKVISVGGGVSFNKEGELGEKHLIDVKSNLGLGNANLNAGGIVGLNGKVHGDHKEISEQGINVNGNLNLGGIGGFHRSSEERKLISVGGGVSLNKEGEIGEKHLIDANGNIGLGNANVNVGGILGLHGKVHGGHKETSEEGKDDSGEQGHGINGKLNLGGIGGFHRSSEERKLISVGGGVSLNKEGEIGEKHLIDAKGNIGLGNANLNVGGILGLNGKVHGGHKETSKEDKDDSGERGRGINGKLNLGGIGGFHRSSEERKLISVGGGVSLNKEGELGEKHLIDANGNIGLGNANVNVGGILGLHGKVHGGHKETSEEGKDDSGEQGHGINGKLNLGGIGGFHRSNEERKLISVGGGVSLNKEGEIGEKHLIDANGNIGLGNANLNLGGILGLNGKVHGGHKETSKEGKDDSGERGHGHFKNGKLKLGSIFNHESGNGFFNITTEKKVIISGKGKHIHGEKKESSEEKDESKEKGHGLHVNGNFKLEGISGHKSGHGIFSSSKQKKVIINGKVVKTIKGGHKETSEEDESGEEQEDTTEEETIVDDNIEPIIVPSKAPLPLMEEEFIPSETPVIPVDETIGTEEVKQEEGKTTEEETNVEDNTEPIIVPTEAPLPLLEEVPTTSETPVINPVDETIGTEEVKQEEGKTTEEETNVEDNTEPIIVPTEAPLPLLEEVPPTSETPVINPVDETSGTEEGKGSGKIIEENFILTTRSPVEEVAITESVVNVVEKPLEEKPNVEDLEPSETSGDEDLPIPTPGTPGEACIFNKDSVADGQSVTLNCVICTCNNGALTCVKDLSCPGVCAVTGYQMIRTFDGSLYESPGTCNYVLVKTSNFSISLKNTPCAENSDAVCIDSVDIYIPSKASLKLLPDGTVLSSGQKTDLPYFTHDTVTVLRSSSVFLDVVSPLFTLQYDFLGNRLYIILDASYKKETNGLCGTYNDNRNDDYRSSSDMTETVSSLFSKSWKVQPQCSENVKGEEDKVKRVIADASCTGALEDSIFEDCQRVIDIRSYKRSCSNSVYFGDTAGFCSAIADYAYRCAQAGIAVPVSSTFTDCALTCQGDMVLTTDSEFIQNDCGDFSANLMKIVFIIPFNEACICPSNLYYDSTINQCVSGDQCPCYHDNQVFKIGEIITQRNGNKCPCERILTCDSIDEPEEPVVVETCPEGELFSDCLVGNGKSCEPSCQNLETANQVCSDKCHAGCVCKYGLLRSSDGSCVPLNECPCVHGDDLYHPGETLAHDCNTCTCEHGKFVCTQNICTAVCNVYAGSQFVLFDNVWKTFPARDCPIILAESDDAVGPQFKVIMENIHTQGFGGALVTKKISITFGGTKVELNDREPHVSYELGSRNHVKIYHSGFYVVADFPEGLTVYYDQHLDVIIQLQPELQGHVKGMCGDADGTTTSEMTISNMRQYATRYLLTECPAPEIPVGPSSDNHRQYVEARCSILKGDDFAECHKEVPVDPYYTACVEETEGCVEGESCLCFCTAIAAYSRACCRKGITLDWRNPDTCPSPCDYYNRESGDGPYRLVMVNGRTLIADYNSRIVSLAENDAPGNLKASFMVTRSLFVDLMNGRKLISLESAQHRNFFIVQQEDGSLSLQKWQPSINFRKQATFILRKSRWIKGFDALESLTSRGSYLSFSSVDDQLVMSKIKSGIMLGMSFKLTEETFGLPSYSVCTWKYRSCSEPCIPTCQDPTATKCTLKLKLEGCYPLCAPGMVFDEITHRCVHPSDCITFIGTTTAQPIVQPKTTPIYISPTTITHGCEHVQCNNEKTCGSHENLVSKPNPSDPCCPLYECVPVEIIATTPSTVTEDICKNVQCEVLTTCEKEGASRVEVPWADPCCPHYICECTATCTSPPSCIDGRPPIRSFDEEKKCCPEYTCSEVPLTPPPKEDLCKDVKCPVKTCDNIDEVLVTSLGDDPCCVEYSCVPKEEPTVTPTEPPCANVPCSEERNCREGDTVVVKSDPADPCCPLYECVPPEIITTTPSTVTEDICKNVQCEVLTTCEKEGASRVEVPWADPCCPHYICECTATCTSPPSCIDGRPPIRSFDEENKCCPEYTCSEVPLTPPPKEDLCKDVKCTVKTCDNIDEVLVTSLGDDPCCVEYSCVPKEEPTVTPTEPPCANVHCSEERNCREGDTVVVKTDPADPCCPLYECVPPEIITTTPSTVTEDICKNVQCEVLTTCEKEGASRVPVPWADTCCPHYICECTATCTSPPSCIDGRPPIRSFDEEKKCCPEYTCSEVPLTPPPKEDLCKDVKCTVKTCDNIDEVLVTSLGDDPCCVEYSCVPKEEPTVTPTEPPCANVHCSEERNCREGDTVVVKTDPADPCCPLYECVPPEIITTTPSTVTEDICKNVQCEVLTTCEKEGASRVPVPWADTCCPHYICECTATCTSPPSCIDGRPPIRSFDEEKKCCPEYTCSEVPLTPPPKEDLCKDVKCTVKTCDNIDEVLVTSLGDDPCCVEYSCVPKEEPTVTPTEPPCATVHCSEERNCREGDTVVVKTDPADPCCPLYECVPPEIITTTPSTVTEDICKNVQCEVLTTCEKEGASRVPVPWADTCCPHYICECTATCTSPPSCIDGRPPIRSFDEEKKCCPEYTCSEVPLTPPPKEDLCKDVKCPVKTCDNIDEVLVTSLGDDPCCVEYSCVPKEEPTVTPTEPPCANVQCSEERNCREGDTVIVKTDPADPCCPLYECVPPATTPASVFSTTTLDTCRDVECPKITCAQKGSTPVPIPGNDPCCADYICECVEECSPPITCKSGSKPTMSIDPEGECCPTYKCPDESVRETTTPPIILTTPPGCENVVCASHKPCSEGEAQVQRPNLYNTCCPLYECVPEQTIETTTPPPIIIVTKPECEGILCAKEKTCAFGETQIQRPNPFDRCCPLYECVPVEIVETTTPPPIIIITEPECENVHCARETTCGPNEVQVQRPNLFDPCCPLYECVPETTVETTTPSPTILTSQPGCNKANCIVPICTVGHNLVEKPNPFDTCCSLYECEPVPTSAIITEIPSTIIPTTNVVTSAKPDCRNAICNSPKICKEHEKLITKLNPLNPCCPLYECECTCKTVPSCGSDERLVAVHQSNQCCPRLKCERKRDECHPVPKEVTLTSGQCSASVILSVCSGYCHSSTEYSHLWRPVSKCRCCSVSTTRDKNFELPCIDGTRARLTVQEALECGCNRCWGEENEGSGEESGSGEGSASGSASGTDEGSGDLLWGNF
ncbi:uncharacterized protein O3C94_014768 isoform 3-T3 [Discoglossus pictus]